MKFAPIAVLALTILTVCPAGAAPPTSSPVRAASPSSFPAPGGLWAQPTSSTTIQLKWEAVPGATGYEVHVWRNGKWTFNEDDPNLTPIATGTTLTGLQPGQPYEFAVKAVGPGGITSVLSRATGTRTPTQDGPIETVAPPPSTSNTSASAPSTPSGPTLAPTRGQTQNSQRKSPPPDSPSGLFGYFSGTDVIKLTWRKTADTLRYSVEEEKNGQWVSAEKTKGDSAQNGLTLTDRPMPGPYRFRVRAVNREGTASDPSLPITVEQ